MEKKQILATVGDRRITQKDVEFVMNNFDQQTAMQFNSPDGQKRILDELVNQELFYLDGVESNIDQEEEFKAQLEKMKADFTKQYYMNKLLGNISVDDSEAIEFYGLNKEMFVNPESVKASHILVDTEEQAQKVLNEINNGVSFEDAAKEYSKCPSKDAGGDLGFFTRGKMVPEFEEASFKMNVGDTSAPVKTQFGYHLIKLTDKKQGGEMSFDEVKEGLKTHLVNQKQQEVYFAKVNELKKKYPVKVVV